MKSAFLKNPSTLVRLSSLYPIIASLDKTERLQAATCHLPAGLSTRNTHLPITALLHFPKLQRPQHLSPETVGRVHERQLVVVDRRAFPDEVDFGRFEQAGAFDEFPGEEGYWGCWVDVSIFACSWFRVVCVKGGGGGGGWGAGE